MNKQEAIREMNKTFPPKGFTALSTLVLYSGDVIDLKSKLVSIINQIEPEKPVIPQFVAEWIEVCKEHLTTSLYTAMNPNFMKENSQSFDLILWIKKTSNQDLFARAWLDGYEVEKEKLYTAEFKLTGDFLLWDAEQGEYQFCDCVYGNFTNELTEGHLKNLDIWDNPAFEIKEADNEMD